MLMTMMRRREREKKEKEEKEMVMMVTDEAGERRSGSDEMRVAMISFCYFSPLIWCGRH